MGSVDIPKDKGLELHITKTIYPDSKRVGTTPTKTPSGFFSDPTNRNYGGATALTSPKTFDDTYESSFNDLYEFGRSVSSFQGQVEDWELVQNEMETKFGIEIPHFLDYIPEVDDKYLISPTDPTGIGFALSGKEPGAKAPHKEKIRYIENLVKNKLSELPAHMQSQFKGYDHYFDLRKKQAADTQEQMALNMQYADSGWDKWGGMLSGTAVASFHDPLILGTLPISMMYGWQGGIIYATMRTAAIEAIIAGGAETIIQSQVVPYRQSLGQDYDWSDAAKIIGTVSATSGVFAGTLTAGVKGSAQLYKNAQMALAKTNPKLRNKIIGKEFKKLVDQGADPDLLLNYIKDRINELPPTEMVQLFKTFPEAIQLHAPYQSAARELEEKILEDVDNPLSKNIEGNVEHMERTNSSLQSVLRNEEPKIPEQPNSQIVLDEKRPVMNHVKMNPDDIEVDAKTFQFKTGGDSKGVLTTLKGVEKWDHNAAGTVMVWERADGKFFIADGHQRLGLAKRIKSKDPKQDVYLMTVVRREADGWNAEDVMVEAMTVNIVSGTARSEDVARVFLRMGETHTANILSGKIKPQQALYQNSLGLYRLGDEAFRYWLKGGIKDNIAAQVGHLIDDPQLAINALKLLERTKPANINEARSIIRSFVDAGIIKTEQTDLFGSRIIKESLIVERSKVYSSALRELKKDKTIFKALVENDEAIIKSGRNKLDTNYNVEKAEQYGIIIHKIEKLANRKGRLSDELTAAAKLWKSGSKRKAVESFKKAVYESIERGDHEGITPSGSERSIFASQSESPARQKPKENIITEKLKVHDDPHDTNVAVKEADDQLEEIKVELEEIKSPDLSEKIKYIDNKGKEIEIPRYVYHRPSISLENKKIKEILKERKIKLSVEKFRLSKDPKKNEILNLADDRAIKEINEKGIENISGYYDTTRTKAFLAEAEGKQPSKFTTYLNPDEKNFSTHVIDLAELDLKKLNLEPGGYGYTYDGKIPKKAIRNQAELTDEIKSGVASGERRTSDTTKPLESTQDEFFQTTTASPPSTVLAKAKGTPSASRILDDNSIGEVKAVSGINHKILQISDSVDNLYKLANKNIKDIEASITNIAIKFKNAKVITNIKKKLELKRKLKNRQDDFGKDYDIRFIGDIARGRIVLENLDEVVDGLNIEGWLRQNYKIISKKDYFATPKESGYRATHYQLVTEDGLAFELQVHHKDLLNIYDKLRDLPSSAYNKFKNRKLSKKEKAERIKLVAKEKKIFDDTWSKIQVEQKGLPEQRAVDIGLFDATARNQLDLTDEVVMDIKTGADGELVPDTKTLKQVLDDVEEDDKIINFLKDCPGIS